MLETIAKYITSLILALIVFVNSVGNFIGVGDIIETQPPTTTTTTTTEVTTTVPEWYDGEPNYRYNSKEEYYYIDDKECWQKDASYNEVYGYMAPATGMFIDQVRIRFNYEGKDWMIQMWKGQYGFLLVGSEVCIFTAPGGTYNGTPDGADQYNCPAKEDWLDIQHEAYWDKDQTGEYKKIFTREYEKHWWATGFVKGQLTKYTVPKTELITATRITFKSEEMANLFVKGLEKAGFAKTDEYDKLTGDSYCQSGADVYINWVEIHQDVNVVNGEAEPSTAINTTAPTKLSF